MTNTKIYLVHWKYHDQSGGEFVKAFESAEAANELFEIMRKHADGREWFLTEIVLGRDD